MAKKIIEKYVYIPELNEEGYIDENEIKYAELSLRKGVYTLTVSGFDGKKISKQDYVSEWDAKLAMFRFREKYHY